MKNISLIFLFVIFSVTLLFSQEQNQKSVSLTIYNNNLGVVKDVRNINSTPGISIIKISDVAKYIDPTSVHIDINGTVLEQNYRYDLASMNKILSKYLEQKINLISEKGEVLDGKLISVNGNQLVLQKEDGGLLMLPNSDKYRIAVEKLPEGLISKPTLVWLVNSKEEGPQDVEISYQTNGMEWHAEYVALLNSDEDKLDLNSWVSIKNNSGATFKNAKIKLIAGDVNRIINNNYNRMYKPEMVMSIAAQDEPQFKERSFFEYHIYQLQRNTTLRDNETKQISLFEAQNITAKKRFIYRSNGYSKNNKKVDVVVEFKNSAANNLNIPMPKGKVRVYKSDGDDIEFIGEDLIDHTPKGETIKLKIGQAFDIVVNEKRIENNRISDKVNEQYFETTITNHKEQNIVVEVERTLGYKWKILKTNFEFEKINSNKIVFKIPVKASQKTVLKYKFRYTK